MFQAQYVRGAGFDSRLCSVGGSGYVSSSSWDRFDSFVFMFTVQFSLFMHPDQAENTSSGIQGQEATAVAVIYVTAPRSSRKTTKYK